MSFISLLIGVEKIDNRININTGMLIASAMFHVALMSSLPPMGYLTLADRVLMATYVVVGFNLLQTVRMLRRMAAEDVEAARRITRTALQPTALLASRKWLASGASGRSCELDRRWGRRRS